MKHLTTFALLGTVALVAAGCQREIVQTVPDNPTYDPEKGEVTTQFVLNIAPGTTPKTKLGADVAQVGNNPFRGMQEAHLLTYELNANNKKGSEYFIFTPGDATAKATRDYDLGTLVAAGEITDEQSSRILELSLPLKTNALAFYAKAYKPDAPVQATTNLTPTESQQMVNYHNKYGKLIAVGEGFNATLEGLNFSLVSRLTDEQGFKRFGNLLAGVLTAVVRAECKKESDSFDRRYAYWWPQDETSKQWATRVGGVDYGNPLPADDADRIAHEAQGYTYVVGTASWFDMGDKYAINHDDNLANNVYQTGLEEVLGEAFYQLTTITSKDDGAKTELRAGSAASVLKTMRDLNDVLNRVLNSTPTSQAEQAAIEMAREIRFRMNNYFTTSDDYKSINYKPIAQIVAAAQQYFPNYSQAIAGSNFDQSYLPNNTTLEGGFPLNLGLPMSTALLTYVANQQVAGLGHNFQYLDAVPAYGMNAEPVPLTDYRFAPEIIYWGNSGIRVNDAVKAKADYPHTVDDWADNLNSQWTDWTNNGSVLSTTRSVAMIKQINYGVALLQTNVSYDNLDGELAYDNNQGIHPSESDKPITITGTSFKVTGVMIGGVREKVGWDLMGIIDPVNNKPNKVIYDRVEGSGTFLPAPNLTGAATFYTTTWDSYIPKLDNTGNYLADGEQEDQTDVYIALELVNNTGKDIWGELNIIRNGGTFYLVGKLDLAQALANNTVTFPDSKYVHYPPYDAEGNTIQVKRVFMQDYMTVANVHFTKHSLRNAYVTVPDLRSSQVSLGLNVDLTWNPGLTFHVDL